MSDERWTERVKLLEARAEVANRVLNGQMDDLVEALPPVKPDMNTFTQQVFGISTGELFHPHAVIRAPDLGLLKRLEWCYNACVPPGCDMGWCPICHGFNHSGHKAGCAFAKLLRRCGAEVRMAAESHEEGEDA